MNSIIESDIEKMVEDITKQTSITSDVDTKELSSPDYEYKLKLTQADISDEKELVKFIRGCEQLIRTSPEYKLWVAYVHEVLGLTNCSITNESHSNAKSDLHHTPYTLFSIVKAVILKHINDEKEFCSFDICKEVISLHYELRIGFCMLLKSAHEMVHNSALKIPMILVKGDYKYFYNHYVSYLNEDEIKDIDEKLAVNETNCEWTDWIKRAYNKKESTENFNQ